MYEELVRDLRNWSKAWGEESNPIGPVPIKRLAEAANAIEELSKPRWISVTERLPEDKLMVIGFTPCDGFMFVGYHVTSVWNDHDFSYWNIVTAMRSTRKMTKKVTHWVPLPEPPKEE